MATVRIFLPTYRRPSLLRRAVASLRAQTFPDWVCELHNDDPADTGPARLAAELGDARIGVVEHARNLGGTGTFNLFFRPTPEPFYAMLEDDNSWEPEFLERMLAAARDHPTVTVFWSNMRVWEEQADGTLRDTARLLWPDERAAVRRLDWGQARQIAGALHSNGALLVRSVPGADWTIPPVPFAAVEPFRERAMPHPILLVTRPLANFSITRQSTRSRAALEWAEIQAMLTATFFRRCPWSEAERRAYWVEARRQTPPATTALLLAALLDADAGIDLRHSRARDWWILVRGFLRRPRQYLRLRRSRRDHRAWWDFLAHHTALRWQTTTRKFTAP